MRSSLLLHFFNAEIYDANITTTSFTGLSHTTPELDIYGLMISPDPFVDTFGARPIFSFTMTTTDILLELFDD